MTLKAVVILVAVLVLVGATGRDSRLQPAFSLTTPLWKPANSGEGNLSMEPKLTSLLITQLVGMLFFIEIMQQMILKPVLKPYENRTWHGLAMNGLTILIAFGGGCLGSWGLKTLSGPKMVDLFLTALEASFIATFGYEIVKNFWKAYKGLRE